MKQRISIRYIALMAIFTALAYAAVVLTKWIPNVQGFLSYEPKDALIVIAGFIFGPMSCVIIAVLTALLEFLTISGTGLWGFLMNALATCAFTVPAALIYTKIRTQKGAVIGLGAGVLSMAAVMLLWNYIVTPFYMHVPRAAVAKMLVPVFLPFNLVKGGLNAGLAMLLYKPIVTALRHAGLVAPSQGKKGRFSLGFTLFVLAVLATFVLLFLIMIGVI